LPLIVAIVVCSTYLVLDGSSAGAVQSWRVDTRILTNGYFVFRPLTWVAWSVLLEVRVHFGDRFEILGDPRGFDSLRLADLVLICGAS